MAGVTFRILGVNELKAAISRMVSEVEATTQEIIRRSQVEVENAAKAGFTAAHTAGTPTPSAAGSPPAVVTGTLRRSIRSDTPTLVGLGGFVGHVYPTSIYARIQELGGQTGRNHATTLPARPYLAPALDKVRPALSAISRELWGKAIRH